jgi:hypothetical protein
MLTRKNLLWLTAVLVVLIVLATVQRTSHERATSRPSSQVLLPGEYSRSDLSSLAIGHGQGHTDVLLSSGPEGWYVPTAWNARANGQRIDTLLRSLANLRGEFRSDNPDVLADYGFTDSTSVFITGFDTGEREIFAIEIGRRPQGGMGTFVKLPQSSEVFLTNQNLLSNLGLWSGPEPPQNRHFLELQALRLDKQDIDAIRLEGDGALTMTKEHVMIEPAEEDTVRTEAYPDRSQWEWRLDTGQRAVKTRADGVLNTATSLRAQDVVDPDADLAQYGLDEPDKRAVLVHADGSQTVIAFGDYREMEGTTPGGFYTLVGNDPTVWITAEFNVDTIFKTREDLLPEN